MKTNKTLSYVSDEGEEVSIECEITYYIDNNFGADADGNRGERVVFVDEVIPEHDVDDKTYEKLIALACDLDLEE
jgi:hypothetical protein